MTDPASGILDELRRWPDVEAPELVAVDATDRLLLDEAADDVRAAAPGGVVVVGDRYGALTLGVVARHGATTVRVHQDSLVGQRALDANAARTGLAGSYAQHPLGADLVRGATVVIMQLPKALAALDEIAEVVAAYADPAVVLHAGGRVKHMTPSMNGVLGRSFGDVRASPARQKSRLLVARRPHAGVAPSYPRRERHDDLDLTVCAHGAAFGGTKVDIGTRFLIGFLDRMASSATSAVDLGCGTGVLATALARRRPELSVVATDESAAAIASTRATLRANGVERVTVLLDDAMSTIPAGSVDLVLCNPPFHQGTTVEAGVAPRLFRAAARVLAPGGELWTVFNTPLAHGSVLRRLVGATEVAGRNAKFTVTVSRPR